MSDYTPPLDDMRFVLNELADLDAVACLPGYGEVSGDLVDAVLEQSARLHSEVIAPTNRAGDEHPARLVERSVVTSPGFADAYRAYAEAGYNGLAASPEAGGQGLPELLSVVIAEMTQSANLALSLCPMLTQGAIHALEVHGSDQLKSVYLPQLVSGEWTGTMNLTEPQAGSDLAAVRTRAEPDGDHYRLTGQKIFITWGDHDMTPNIVHMVLARLPDAPPGTAGLSLFLVPKRLVGDDGEPGERNDLAPVSIEHKLGIHGSPTCVMSYGDNGGAVGWLVGEPNRGLACMFTMMNRARLAVGLEGLALAERAYQQAVAYASQRVQGRSADGPVTIIHHPDVRRMLMAMRSATEAMRALAYPVYAELDHAARADRDRAQAAEARVDLLTPVIKGWLTEMANEVTSLGIQVHGGMGYIEETGAAQHYRDARILSIYEGTNGIQALDLVGRKLLRDGGRAMSVLLDDMERTVDELQAAGAALGPIASAFATARGELATACEWVLANAEAADVPETVAFPMLMLTGYVGGGWQMARAALAARRRIDAGDNADRLHAKLVTARFYAEHYLPRATGLLATIRAGAESTMALPPEQL